VRRELRGGEAAVGALLEQRADEPLRAARDPLPELRVEGVVGVEDELQHVARRRARPLEGVAAREHDEEHDAQRPHVHRRVVRHAAVHLLGRPVRPRAHLAVGKHLLPLLEDDGRAEVDQLDVRRVRVVLHEHEVLGLEVAVHHAARVHVVHGRRDLPRQLGGHQLCVRAMLEQPLEELAALGELHYQVVLAVGLRLMRRHVERREQLHDVRMARTALHRVHLHVE
jgi:hypothetical protein